MVNGQGSHEKLLETSAELNMDGLRIWRFTDCLLDGTIARYALQDQGGNLRLDPDPPDSAIGTYTARTPLKILQYFVESNGLSLSKGRSHRRRLAAEKRTAQNRARQEEPQLSTNNLREHLKDRAQTANAEGSYGRLFIKIGNTDLMRFGGHEIQLVEQIDSVSKSIT